MLNGILWILRTGAPWRDLPERFGPWKTVCAIITTSSLESRHLKLGDIHPHTVQALNNLINLYEAWNKPEEAEKWRVKLVQIEDSKE